MVTGSARVKSYRERKRAELGEGPYKEKKPKKDRQEENEKK